MHRDDLGRAGFGRRRIRVVDELAHQLGRYVGPQTAGRPAALRIVDPSKARLVLKHQAQLSLRSVLSDYGEEGFREFFLNASWTASSLFGWWGRGVIFRQP